ncbi:MAG: amidinotransferase [Bacteroidetes bacterium]|nr:amidinotransferase [Bacteroidota bacterium]MBS1650194.1 amidinotransferase [Bacteroidota bacterium]
MIEPAAFTFNEQTAVNNSFQSTSLINHSQHNALEEFNLFVQTLRKHDIDVTVIKDTEQPHTPDSVFPNNWISFHSNGTVILYPMFAPNRRLERKEHVLNFIEEKFHINKIENLSAAENKNIFLEGTGSMVLDRTNKIAYACISPRTHKDLFEEWCKQFNFNPISFTATDVNGNLIYHTNVMMCIAEQFVVICLDTIKNIKEKEILLQQFKQTNKEIIEISFNQMNHFGGNMLQVKNKKNKQFLVMSSQAYNSLTETQIQTIEKYNSIIHSNIKTIETNGGGSARCMIAEIFLQPKWNL